MFSKSAVVGSVPVPNVAVVRDVFSDFPSPSIGVASIPVHNVPISSTSKGANVPFAPSGVPEEFDFVEYYAKFGLRIRKITGDG